MLILPKISCPAWQAVELTNGQRFYGTLAKPENENMVMVSAPLGVANVDVEDVFLMYPVAANFWERLDVNVDFGLSWDKGSEIGKYSLGVDAQYRHTESI